MTGNPNANSVVLTVVTIQTTGAKFQINNAKLYVSVVILSINGNNLRRDKARIHKNNFLEQI